MITLELTPAELLTALALASQAAIRAQEQGSLTYPQLHALWLKLDRAISAAPAELFR